MRGLCARFMETFLLLKLTKHCVSPSWWLLCVLMCCFFVGVKKEFVLPHCGFAVLILFGHIIFSDAVSRLDFVRFQWIISMAALYAKKQGLFTRFMSAIIIILMSEIVKTLSDSKNAAEFAVTLGCVVFE